MINILSKQVTHNIAKIRVSVLNLLIETGRYGKDRLDRGENRRCKLCESGNIEDEFHFIFEFSVYADLTETYIILMLLSSYRQICGKAQY